MRITLLSVLLIFMGLNVFSQSDTENYVVAKTYQKETLTPISQHTPEELLEEISYFDGLGRAKQVITRFGGGSQEDLITPMVYDDFGRQAKSYLPYARTSGTGSIVLDPLTEVSNFYNTFRYENTLNPFSETQFEASPLNRIEMQAAPGNDWAMGGGHEIEFSNQSNATEDQVRLYHVEFPTGDTASPSLVIDADGFYGAGQLYRTITRNENHIGTTKNHTTEEFTDKQGRVILKRTYADINTELEAWHDTYYVYDDYGNLTYVLPPKMDASTATLASISGNMNALGYQYKYDYRNRLIEKQIPGKGEEFIIYNILDQPVLSQDANQSLTNKWLYTKYDAFARVVSTGIYTHPSNVDQKVMQLELDNHYVGSTPPKLYEEKSGTGYTNRSFPTTGLETLTENYYDDYNFHLAGLSIPSAISDGTTIEQTKVKGLATGSKVKVLETQDWITTINGFDKKGRVIWLGSKNTYLDTEDTSETIFNFTGSVLKSTATHNKEGQAAAIVVEDFYNYDHIGRMLKHTQSINGASAQLIAENTYDELGQLIKKEVGSGIGNGSEAVTTNVFFTNTDKVVINEEIGGIIRENYTNRGWDAGASTVEKLTGDGYMEFHAPYDNDWAIGLSYTNPDHTMESVDYCIKSYYHGFKIYENGVDQGIDLPAVSIGTYRIERDNNAIKYYYNSSLVYTSPTPVQGDLIGDIALYKSDSEKDSEVKIYALHNEGDVDHLYNGYYTVEGIRVYDSGVMAKVRSDVNSELKTFGSINGNGKVTWRRQWYRNPIYIHFDQTDDAGEQYMAISSGSITTGSNGSGKNRDSSSGSSDIFSIERLDNKILYRLNGQIFHESGVSSFGNLEARVNFAGVGAIIYYMDVENYSDFADYNKRTTYKNASHINVSDVGELIVASTRPSGTTGGIATVQSLSEDGYLEVDPVSSKTWYAGLSHQDNGSGFESIEYCIAHLGTNDYIKIYENGVDKNISQPFVASDLFRVERVGSQINYKQNGTTFYVSNTPASGNLLGDLSLGSEGVVIANAQLYDNTLRKTFSQTAEYEQIVGLQVNPQGGISKPGQNNWQSELVTRKEIADNGSLSFSPLTSNIELIAGLTTFNSVSKPYQVNYGLHFKTNGSTEIIENGIATGTTFSYLSNDSFHINRQSNQVRFYKNDNLIYSASVPIFQPLLGKLSVYSQGGGVSYLTLEELQTEGSLQQIDYTYNIRGWLIQINDPSNLGEDLFGNGINYNKPNSGATPLFNGNISETHWSSLSENSSSNLVSNQYRYSYDALNRITEAIDNTTNYNLSGITYDKMGNILSLHRQGQLDAAVTGFGTMDNLNYSYNTGNQLQQVDDFSGNLEGFKDGNQGVDYGYDANGNLTSDANKGITNITYNHLNLPVDVEFNGSSSQTIHYTYDATGTKIQKEIPGKITDYAGDFVYEQLGTGSKELQFFSHPEGYVSYENGQFKYVYNYVDHLGNVRLSYTDGDGNGSIDPATEIIQEKNYYPFGLIHQGYNNGGSSYGNVAAKRYGFGGKELQDETFSGNFLDWYDFGARNYDPSLGRWMNPDPYSEYMYSYSPFNYTFNNPVYFTDPDGLCPNGDCDDVDGSNEGNTTASDGATWVVSGGSWVRDDGELDEVVVTSSSSSSDDIDDNDESTAGNSTVWGAEGGTETSGRKGITSSSIEWDDFTTFGGGGASVRNKLLNLIRTIIEGLGIGENVVEEIDKSIHKSTTPLPNESSMENKVEEEAKNTSEQIKATIEKSALRDNGRTVYSVTWEQDTLMEPNSKAQEIQEKYKRKSDSIQKLIHTKKRQ